MKVVEIESHESIEYQTDDNPLDEAKDNQEPITQEGMKVCPYCGQELSVDGFYKNPERTTGLTSWCKACFWGKSTDYNNAWKKEVFSHYGNPVECVTCGETDIEKLCLDHVNGGGNADKERIAREMGIKVCAGVTFYKWLKDHGYPNDPPLQILCKKCNRDKQTLNKEF